MSEPEYAVTCVEGNSNDIMPHIMRLYVPEGSWVADVTYGRGVFWKDIDASKYHFLPSDLEQVKGIQANFFYLPYPDESLDALFYDPPFLYTGGWKTLRGYFHDNDSDRWSNSSYGNKERSARGKSGVEAVDRMYYEAMREAARVLKHKAFLIIKCMDQVQSGKQEWAHIKYHNYAEELGFRNEDLFILKRASQPLMRHPPESQQHARRNHSYFMVQKRWRK